MRSTDLPRRTEGRKEAPQNSGANLRLNLSLWHPTWLLDHIHKEYNTIAVVACPNSRVLCMLSGSLLFERVEESDGLFYYMLFHVPDKRSDLTIANWTVNVVLVDGQGDKEPPNCFSSLFFFSTFSSPHLPHNPEHIPASCPTNAPTLWQVPFQS